MRKLMLLFLFAFTLTAFPVSAEVQQDKHSLEKLQSAPLFLSWYDPALCLPENGGITTNCDSDPTKMAGGHLVEEWYDMAAACPAEMYGLTIHISGIGDRVCLDRGGRIEPTYRVVYTANGFVEGWFIVIDILHRHQEPPWWQYTKWDDWYIKD